MKDGYTPREVDKHSLAVKDKTATGLSKAEKNTFPLKASEPTLASKNTWFFVNGNSSSLLMDIHFETVCN